MSLPQSETPPSASYSYGVQDQQIPQPPQQQPQEAPPPPPREVLQVFNEKQQIILEANGDLKRKIKAYEELREQYDELFLKEHLNYAAQAAIQMFLNVFQTVPIACYDDLDSYQLRKASLDLVNRFVPADMYKSCSRPFDDLIFHSIVNENEQNAVTMLKFLTDYLRQKSISRIGIIQIIRDFRIQFDNLIRELQNRPDAFARQPFDINYIENEDYRNQFLNKLYFETPVKPKRVNIYPRAVNSIKVVCEFSILVSAMVTTSTTARDDVQGEIPEVIKAFTRFLSLNCSSANADSEFVSTFQDAQLKVLSFIITAIRSRDNSGLPVFQATIQECQAQIAQGVRTLFRSLSASSINIRKEILLAIKNLFNTDFRINLIDMLPDLCFDEILFGPPSIMTPTLRSDLIMIKAENFHSIRTYIDWNVFQHLLMNIIRDLMDFTMTPSCQNIYGKVISNFIDASTKAESKTFCQLAISFSYDSARSMYEGILFALIHKIDVLTRLSVKPLLVKGNKSLYAPKLNEFYDSDEEDDNNQMWMDDEVDPDALVSIDCLDEPIDEFERKEPLSENQGQSFVSTVVQASVEEDIENLESDDDASLPETLITTDTRIQMAEMNQPFMEKIDILPLIESHSEIPPEKSSTIIYPDSLPYGIQETRALCKGYLVVIQKLLSAIHQDDDIKSDQPSMVYVTMLNKLFRNFFNIFELWNLAPSPNPPNVAPHNQNLNSNEDKEIFDVFFAIFSSIHPAVYERIFRHHAPYIIRRASLSNAIQHFFQQVSQSQQLAVATSGIIFDYFIENLDVIFAFDDDDKHRIDIYTKLLKLVLGVLAPSLRYEPLAENFVPKIQSFFVKIFSKGIYYVTRMFDSSHLMTTLKTILRICGAPQADHLYRLFLPLFPSFLQWFSSIQNTIAADSLQEHFIELCLTLPARLSSLVPYMSLLVDPEINSFQNSLVSSQQGLRTIELCLDNYSSTQVKDFFGNAGIARLLENLWSIASSSMDHQLMLQSLKLIGKLSSLNRNAICDIQKLNFSVNERTSEVPALIVSFERSGKNTNDIMLSKLSLSNVGREDNLEYINKDRMAMFTPEPLQTSTKPMQANLLLRPVISQCVASLKTAINTERSFMNSNRSDAPWMLLTWIRAGFDSYGCVIDKDEFIARLLIQNNAVIGASEANLNIFNVSFAFVEPFKCSVASARQMYIDCLVGLAFAVANADLKSSFEDHFEELTDFLTLQLHIETSCAYFQDRPSTAVYPSSMDAYILIDAVIEVLKEPWSRFHACAFYMVFRMIQTALSFTSTPERALNIPMFHFLCREVGNRLCSQSEINLRLGGASLLEIIVENLPRNFLIAAFDTILNSVFDVLHFGDDDISLTSQECAFNTGKKLIDRVLSPFNDAYNLDVVKYLAEIAWKNRRSGSYWTNKLVCEILTYLRVQKVIPPEQLFSSQIVQEYYASHEIDFLNSKLEYRLLQLNFLIYFLPCGWHTLELTEKSNDYLRALVYCYALSDEHIVNSPNYDTIPPHSLFGTNPVPSSPLMRHNAGLFFADRLKRFRSVVAEAMTTLCLAFQTSNSINILPEIVPESFTISTTHDAATLLLSIHVQSLLLRVDQRLDYSTVAFSKISSQVKIENKLDMIQRIVDQILQDSTRLCLYKSLNAMVLKAEDLPYELFTKLVANPDSEYTSFCQYITKLTTLPKKLEEYFAALISICKTTKYWHEAFFKDLVTLLSSEQILMAFELGELDLYAPVAALCGSLIKLGQQFNNYFLDKANLKRDRKRRCYLTLISHRHGKKFLTTLSNYEDLLISLLESNAITNPESDKVEEYKIDCMTVDEFVLKILTQLAATFTGWFAKNIRLAEVLRKYILSDYFRGNYLMRDFGIDQNDRLRLMNFKIQLASNPDMVISLLINWYSKNLYKFEVLFATCTVLPQLTFSDNTILRNFISTFLAPRAKLHWRRQLLKFAMDKFLTVFDFEATSEEALNRHCDAQIYVGNFYIYVVVPIFTYALERFRAQQTFSCEHDHFIEKSTWSEEDLEGGSEEDLVDEFCAKVLERFSALAGKPESRIRPEISHGILQLAILLIQRASAHIHPPGSKKQSKHLQIIMTTAWQSLSPSGIFVDRWLRAVACFLLTNVMNAVYIKRDIVYQVFECLIMLPDIRENPVAHKALDGVATHCARRRDECYAGLLEKIKEALSVDGFNFTKAGNILLMLANNYEAFFPARGQLLPSIVFAMIRAQTSRQLSFTFTLDGLDVVIGWEDMRTKKFVLQKDNIFRSNQSDRARIQNQLTTLSRNANFLAMDRVLADCVSLMICKLFSQLQDPERLKRFVGMFSRAIKVIPRPLCSKIEKILTVREVPVSSPHYTQMIGSISNHCKVLITSFVNSTPEAVNQCAFYLQPVFVHCLKTQNIPYIEIIINLIAKIMEAAKDTPFLESKFAPMFNTLSTYFTYMGDSFVANTDYSAIAFMLSTLKTISMANDTALTLFCGPHLIKVMTHMVRTYRNFAMLPQRPNDTAGVDRRPYEHLLHLMEIFMSRAATIPGPTMALYSREVLLQLAKTSEGLNPKILDVLCKTLEEATKAPHVIRQTHVAIAGALTRYHTQPIMKSNVALTAFVAAVAAIMKSMNDPPTEILIPYYLGLTAPVDFKIRSALLEIYESKLPKNIYDRLCYLFTVETWQLVNVGGILPLIVEMLVRSIKDFDPEQLPTVSDGQPVLNSEAVVSSSAVIKPPFAFWSTIRDVASRSATTHGLPDPDPCSEGTFVKTDIKYLPKRLKNICESYFGVIERSSDLLDKRFSEFSNAYISVINQEIDISGKVFVELFTTLWASMTDQEREFIAELYSQFLQLPIFNGASEKTTKYFWQAIQRCDPPMAIDRTKIVATLGGFKNIQAAIYSTEMSLCRSVNLLEPVTSLRQMYRLIGEEDMAAETWDLFSYVDSAKVALRCRNQSLYGPTVELIKKIQAEYVDLFRTTEKASDAVYIAIKNEFDMITDEGIGCLKQLGRWDDVYKQATRDGNKKVASEAQFHLLENEGSWVELESLTRSYSTSENISDAFLALTHHIMFVVHRNDQTYGSLFCESGPLERLASVAAEKFRRLPSYYSPKYHEVLAELSLYVDVVDGATMFREVNNQQVHLRTVIDTTLKQLILHWFYRTISPADSLEFVQRFYGIRLIFLQHFNHQLRTRHPDLNDPANANFTLTPMHTINEFYHKRANHFRRYSLYYEAKRSICDLPRADWYNAYDYCVTLCSIIRCTIKQRKYQPTSLSVNTLKTEIDEFLSADTQAFTADCAAMYAVTRGQLFHFLEREDADAEYALAFKLLLTLDRTQSGGTAKSSKVFANYMCERYSQEFRHYKMAVSSLLRYISREASSKATRYVSKLVFLLKELSASQLSSELAFIFEALGPKCRMIHFLPFLHTMALDVTQSRNHCFAILLALVAQVFPLHVLHAVYLQVGAQQFYEAYQQLRKSQSIKMEEARLNKAFDMKNASVQLQEYVQFQLTPDSSPKMESFQRNGVLFKAWPMNKPFETSEEMFQLLLKLIYAYVPADFSAFASVLHGLESTSNSFIEQYYRRWLKVWAVLTDSVRNGRRDSTSMIAPEVKELEDGLNHYLQTLKDAENKGINELQTSFPKLAGSPEDVIQEVADYFVVMEKVYEAKFSTVKLQELSQDLYNFTNQEGRVISLSSFMEPNTGHCIPTIMSFSPTVRIFAKNGKFFKQLDVRLSNGKIVSYYIETGSREAFFKSATNAYPMLNIPLERFPDTNRRGALIRVPNVFQLESDHLFEINHCGLNRYQNTPWSFAQ